MENCLVWKSLTLIGSKAKVNIFDGFIKNRLRFYCRAQNANAKQIKSLEGYRLELPKIDTVWTFRQKISIKIDNVIMQMDGHFDGYYFEVFFSVYKQR